MNKSTFLKKKYLTDHKLLFSSTKNANRVVGDCHGFSLRLLMRFSDLKHVAAVVPRAF